MVQLLFWLLRLALLVFWLTVVGGAIRRRLSRARWTASSIDRVLTRTLWIFAYSCAAFLASAGLVFVNMLMNGPKWLDSVLLLVFLCLGITVAITGSVCGIRAAREQRVIDDQEDATKHTRI